MDNSTDLLTDDTAHEYTDDGQLIEVYSEMSERNSAINELVHNITELSEIFKDLSDMIVLQGTILDRIDYNIIQTVESTQKAKEELGKAEEHQKCTRAVSCIILLLALIFLMVLVLVIKHI